MGLASSSAECLVAIRTGKDTVEETSRGRTHWRSKIRRLSHLAIDVVGGLVGKTFVGYTVDVRLIVSGLHRWRMKGEGGREKWVGGLGSGRKKDGRYGMVGRMGMGAQRSRLVRVKISADAFPAQVLPPFHSHAHRSSSTTTTIPPSPKHLLSTSSPPSFTTPSPMSSRVISGLSCARYSPHWMLPDKSCTRYHPSSSQ